MDWSRSGHTRRPERLEPGSALTEQIAEREEAAGAGDIAGDLGAQGFDIGEALLGAQAKQEGDAQGGLPG